MSQIQSYFNVTKDSARLIISGFFDSDVQDLLKAANEIGWTEEEVYTREHWACIKFKK